AGADQFKPFGMLIVFGRLQVTQINTVFFRFIYWLFELFGVQSGIGVYGLQLLRFWQRTGY
ncbi:hypothetical protein ACO1NJ_14375, partial [Staphylococcus aureus]